MTVQVTTFSCSTGTLDVSLTCLTWIRVLGLAVLRFLGSASAASCLQADPVSPDARGRGRDRSSNEPDDRAGEGSRKPEFDDGERGSRRIGDQSDNQSDGPASDRRKESAEDYPPSKHRHTAYLGSEGFHASQCRICDLRTSARSSRALISCRAAAVVVGAELPCARGNAGWSR